MKRKKMANAYRHVIIRFLHQASMKTVGCLIRLKKKYIAHVNIATCIFPLQSSRNRQILPSSLHVLQQPVRVILFDAHVWTLSRKLYCALMMQRKEPALWTQIVIEITGGGDVLTQRYYLELGMIMFVCEDVDFCVWIWASSAETGWPFRGPPLLKLSCMPSTFTFQYAARPG